MPATPKKRPLKQDDDDDVVVGDEEKMQITPPKNPKLDGGSSGPTNSNSQPQTPSPSRLHYQMEALEAALNHYFSPKKRSPGRSPGRPAQRKLSFVASDTDDEKDEGSTAEEDGDEEEDQDENKKPGRRTRTVRKDGTTVVDLAAVKRCFKSLDAHLPADLRTQPNGRTMGQHFAEWSRLLESGQFNILLHGLGSKRRVLDQFREHLTRRGWRVFVADALCASMTVGRLTERMANELGLLLPKGEKAAKAKHKSLTEAAKTLAELIADQEADTEEQSLPIVLIIHNIDSPQLRSRAQQAALAELVRPPSSRVRLIASVDHVNAALIWDQALRDAFAWLHYPLSTLHCYGDEVMASGTRLLGLDAKGSVKSHTVASLDVFWAATTSNMRKILTQLALHAPAREERHRWDPLGIPKFCQILKEEFATTSENALRQQLIEFCDHRLIQLDKDGNIQLLVDRQLLSAFLDMKTANE